MIEAGIIAQVAIESIQPLAKDGILASVVAWLCLRVEKRLDRQEHTMRGLAMGILMDLATRKVLAPSAQRLVEEALRKMGIDPEAL